MMNAPPRSVSSQTCRSAWTVLKKESVVRPHAARSSSTGSGARRETACRSFSVRESFWGSRGGYIHGLLIALPHRTGIALVPTVHPARSRWLVPGEPEQTVVRGVLVTAHAGLNPAGGGDV